MFIIEQSATVALDSDEISEIATAPDNAIARLLTNRENLPADSYEASDNRVNRLRTLRDEFVSLIPHDTGDPFAFIEGE